MSDSFTNYNYVGNTKVRVSIKKTLIGAGNPELLSTICLLSATI